jgi:hypothetical protein
VQDPVQRGFCTRLLEHRGSELIREQWVRDQHFALYRLRRSIASR